MEITVKYVKTFYDSNSFVIALYRRLDIKEFITCKGSDLPQNKNVFYHFEGEILKDDKNKEYFKVSAYYMAQARTKKTITQFFNSDEFLGIGKRVLGSIVEKYDKNVFDVIENNPKELLSVEGMNEDKLHILTQGYRSLNAYNALAKELLPMGITQKHIRKISDAHYTINDIKVNPFNLMVVKGIGFKTCDTISRYLNIALNDIKRIEGGALETLKDFSTNGDTYADDDKLIKATIKKLNDGLQDNPVSKSDVINGIYSLIKQEKIKVEDNHRLFVREYWEAEEKISKAIRTYLKAPNYEKDALLKAVDEYDLFKLSNSQLFASKKSLSSRISVITGGAGTGKTTIMNAIIYAYKKVFPDKEITLLAPTGKASRRISEATGIKAQTIHSRLQLYENCEAPQDFIEDGLVVIDEFSMVDLLLLEKLFMGLSSRCHVIFVGDINQLPSVSAGACLKDIITSGVVPVSYLTEIHRQEGGTIVENSLKVIKGKKDLKYDKNMMFVKANSEDEAIVQIKKIYNYYANLVGIENVALISPLRDTQGDRFRCVADQLNNIIQKETNRSGVTYNPSNTVAFKKDDRVMMWRNTPLASNGDVGTIVNIELDNAEWGIEITVAWENGNTVKYHKGDLDDLTLAYAMSVHKSQGSEYNTVIVPILKEHKCRLFKNNLLYTAITRAKKNVILVGDKEAINYMIDHSETYERKTMLKEKLEKYNN